MKHKWLFLLVFCPLFILYAFSSPATIYWQDSGIYLAGIKTLGIVYPPGFPLYILLGWLWSRSVLFVWPSLGLAKAVHLLSGIFGAATAGVVAVTLHELLFNICLAASKWKTKIDVFTARSNRVIAVGTGLATGLAYSLWSQSINSEVYSLAGFLASLIFYLIFKEVRISEAAAQPADKYKYLAGLFIIWGLSFANHPLTLLFLIPILFLLSTLKVLPLQTDFRAGQWMKLILLFGVSAAVFYIYLPVRSLASPGFEWTKINSLPSLINHVAGRQYYVQELSWKLVDLSKILSFIRLFGEEFLAIGAVFLVAGFIYMLKINPGLKTLAKIGVILGLTFYLSLNFYSQGTEYNFWLIPVYIYGFLITGIGWWYIFKQLGNSRLVLVLGAIIFILSPLAVNLKYNLRSRFVLAQEYGKNLLANLPAGAVLFTLGDADSAITSYLQTVEDFRPDIAVVWADSLRYSWRIRKINLQYPKLALPDIPQADVLSNKEYREFIQAFLHLNIDQTQIFLVQKNIIELPEKYSLIPAGTLWQVNKGDVIINLRYWNYSFRDKDRYKKPERPEGTRKNKNSYGVTTGLERVKYSDEVRNFELQALKNLADLCWETYQNQQTLKVKDNLGQPILWMGGQLLLCARDNYEKMFEVDSDFYRADVWETRAQVYRELGDEEKYREIHNQVLIKSTNK